MWSINGRRGRLKAVKSLVVLLALELLSAACRQDMHDQPKYTPLRPIENLGTINDGRSSRPLVENTVARGQLREDTHLYAGRLAGGQPADQQSTNQQQAAEQQANTRQGGGQGAMAAGIAENPLQTTNQGGNAAAAGSYQGLATTFPFPITETDLRRGRERYEIFCSACHGRLGDGNGMIALRGFRKPPTFHDQRLRAAPVGHFFQVITEGFGAMYDYSAQVEPEDRWRIIAYVRALQLSQNAPASAVPADRLNQAGRPGQAQGEQH